MTKRVDLTGHIYNMLYCVQFQYAKNRTRYWLCKCDYGYGRDHNTRKQLTQFLKNCNAHIY